MTPHLLDQLPFWVGGDLEGAELAGVEAHLAQCPACREAVEEFRIVQGWLREHQAEPFDERDRTRLRQQVMAQVRQEGARPQAPRLLHRGALLAAAAILVAGLVWRLERPTTAPVPAPSAARPIAATPSPTPTQTLSPAPPAPNAAPRLARSQPRTESPPDAEAAPTGPTRIEFQTADPNVRIIWLAQAKPLPTPTEAPPEEP